MRALSLASGAWLALAPLAAAATPLVAQEPARRLLEAGPGYVQFTYPVRPEACGNGDQIHISRSEYRSYDECSHGPGRIRLLVESGRVAAIELRVGSPLPGVTGATDLGQLPAAEAAAGLLQLALEAPAEVGERLVVAAVLAEGQELQPELNGIARSGRASIEARKAAVFWLGQGTEKDDSPMLADLVNDQGLPLELREAAVFALSQEESPAAFDRLIEIASGHGPEKLRSSAIFWLGQQDEEAAFVTLTGLYHQLQDTELREKIIFSVGQQKHPDAPGWLLERVGDESASMKLRESALFWLGQRSDSPAVLTGLYQNVADRDLKERLIFAYSQNEELLGQLIEVAKRETDSDLRRSALFWLGQSNDPAAIAYLEQLINN